MDESDLQVVPEWDSESMPSLDAVEHSPSSSDTDSDDPETYLEQPETLEMSHSQGWPEEETEPPTQEAADLDWEGPHTPILPFEELQIILANPYTDMEDTTSNVIAWVQQLCDQDGKPLLPSMMEQDGADLTTQVPAASKPFPLFQGDQLLPEELPAYPPMWAEDAEPAPETQLLALHPD